MLYIGLDIGSVSVETVVLDSDGSIKKILPYTRHFGEPIKVLLKHFEQLSTEIDTVNDIRVTGAGGKLVASILGVDFINELPAQIEAARRLYPYARSIIDIGGEDSKFIDIVHEDYAMNELCAAGTGSFLDQQASRLGYTIEEFAELALKSKTPPRIAGRCTVFAKTDMIHLQQEATPDYDIIAGLCFALARNFKSEIAKGRDIVPPVLFHGGVAFNKGMVRAFKEVLNLKDDELIVPEYCAWMAAIGAALMSIKENRSREIKLTDCITKLNKYLQEYKVDWRALPPLSLKKSQLLYLSNPNTNCNIRVEGRKVDAYIGVDVGSTSTKVAAIDKHGNLLGEVYLWTAGRPLEAVRECLRQLYAKIGKYINVKGAGTTGSGRYLTGDFIGADVVVNEITAQATAAVHIDPTVDTIFEIGGQDSKYISLDNGVIVDFEMNKVCAAGTGSFLQEQAERLNLRIEEFGDIALTANHPCDLGERCTVFMETNLTSYQRKGVDKHNLVAGLCYSIAKNYLTQVVGKKRIGDHIFFQGAVAFNKGVVAAFEQILGKPITVPPHPHVTGAIGAAMAAMEKVAETNGTRFKGFDRIVNTKYQQSIFICNGCPNHCEIKKVVIEGEATPLYYGARCERYEIKKKEQPKHKLPDLFSERERYLLGAYKPADEISGPRVGIPYASIFHEYLPFWMAFLSELGFKVVLSDRTNKKIIHDGVSHATADFCFPIKVVIGHVINLLEKGVDYLFLPSVIDVPSQKGIQRSYVCPYNQEIPHIIMSTIKPNVKILHPIIFFRNPHAAKHSLIRFGRTLGKPYKQIQHAINVAYKAQETFYQQVRQRGDEILRSIRDKALVIVGRPYNTCDRGANLDIPKILREHGQLVIPADFLPLDKYDVSDWPNMYWSYGYRILAAMRFIKDDERLFPVYLTNFGCGPDSFIHQYVRKELGGKPFLLIEVDEHSAPAGVITRCEAFLDSIKHAPRKSVEKWRFTPVRYRKEERRTVYLPHMGDCAYALWAAFNKFGIPAEIIATDDESLELGRKYTSGKECFPCVITTGDMLKILKHNDPKRVAFFMATAYGPCRFGQYCRLQRIILDELGYKDVPIVSPGAPESLDFYREYDMANPAGVLTLLRALQGVVAIDFLLKLRREHRPYEVNKGETDKIYRKWLKRVCDTIDRGGIDSVLQQAVEEFNQIPVRYEPKPRIAIVGEMFVRSHEYSNNYLERKVEQYGGEVVVPPFYEWGLHTAGTRRMDAIVDGKPIIAWLTKAWELVFKYLERRFGRHVWGALKYPERVEIPKTWGNASRYVIGWFGETGLSIGNVINWIRKGEIDGVINCLPFTCMPGNIAVAAFKRVKEDHGIPVLNVAFDGLEQGTLETRLETFMYQAKRHAERRRRS